MTPKELAAAWAKLEEAREQARAVILALDLRALGAACYPDDGTPDVLHRDLYGWASRTLDYFELRAVLGYGD